MAIIATVTVCEQVGENTFFDKHVSRQYEENRSISDILSWARATTGKEFVSICEVRLSEFTSTGRISTKEEV